MYCNCIVSFILEHKMKHKIWDRKYSFLFYAPYLDSFYGNIDSFYGNIAHSKENKLCK